MTGIRDLRDAKWLDPQCADRGACQSLLFKATQAEAGQPAAPEEKPTRADLLAALKWYADGEHFTKADPDAWDTVSGEPQNWWCDEAGTATIEDGTLAGLVLAGKLTGAQLAALEDGEVIPEQAPAAEAVQPVRTFTRADLLEAVETERNACSIAVWMTLQDALEPDADDKGLEGWMHEAESRVKNRLAHHKEQAAEAAKPPAQAVPATDSHPSSADSHLSDSHPSPVQAQAVRLTDAQIAAAFGWQPGHGPLEGEVLHARIIESAVWAANGIGSESPPPTFKSGVLVRKRSGSAWQGTVCGSYSTTLTPEGYAVESSAHPGSVQIYPVAALEKVE